MLMLIWQVILTGSTSTTTTQASSGSRAEEVPFLTLHLDIQGGAVRDLETALLANFGSEEVVETLRNRWGTVERATRVTKIKNSPPILIIQLSRFRNNNTKIMKSILFPRHLVLGSAVVVGEEVEYSLCAVVSHRGQSATSGHYVADVYNSSWSTWFRCDDSTVTPRAEDQVLPSRGPSTTLAENSETPYILFYQRQGTKVKSLLNSTLYLVFRRAMSVPRTVRKQSLDPGLLIKVLISESPKSTK